MKYRHIIWDYNGTLLNDVCLSVEVMNGLLSKRNLPLLTPDRYRELFDFPVIDYYERLGFDFEKEPFETVGTEFIIEYDKRDKSGLLHKGTFEFLSKINAKGIGQSVLSAREENQLLTELKSVGIYGLFSEVAGLNDHYAGGKTDIGMELISKLKIPKETIIMIGDTIHDAEVAKECGIQCVLLTHGHHPRHKLEPCGVPVLDDFRELRHFLF